MTSTWKKWDEEAEIKEKDKKKIDSDLRQQEYVNLKDYELVLKRKKKK